MRKYMKNISIRKWLICLIIIIITCLIAIASFVIYIDPYFQYHKPLANHYYPMNSDYDRYKNIGIVKNFDYDGLILGDSTVNSFNTIEFNDLFFTESTVRANNQGGQIKETGDLLAAALSSHNDVKVVIIDLMPDNLLDDKDHTRSDITYPSYLYDHDVLDDVSYWFNKDVIFNHCIPILTSNAEESGENVGSFDEFEPYSTFPYDSGYEPPQSEFGYKTQELSKDFSQDDIDIVTGTITQNITDYAKKHPEAQLYVFFPPVSGAYWEKCCVDGNLKRTIEAERLATSLMLKVPSIHVFDYGTRTEITLNLNNYLDSIHYEPYLCTYIMQSMTKGDGLLTIENYNVHFDEEFRIYNNLDYKSWLGY